MTQCASKPAYATFTAPADEIARVLSNVGLVAKKNQTYPTSRVRMTPGQLELTGTDGLCAAMDTTQGVYDGPPSGVVLEIPRDALDAMEKAARPEKRDPVTFEWYPGDGLILVTSTGRESARDASGRGAWWSDIDKLFALAEAGPFELPELCAMDMRLPARFWRVKASNGEHVADWLFTGAEAPVLVKMGETFKGLMMPIKRERFAANVGPEGLW